MGTEYPNSWEHENEVSPFTKDGGLTDVAKNWLYSLSKLDNETIKLGMEQLHNRDSDYAPSPTQFIRHCIDTAFEPVMRQIFDYINRDKHSDWKWTNQIAYNVFKRLQYNPANNENSGAILKRAKSIFKSLDKNNLDPVPDTVKQIEQKPPSDVERKLNKFRLKINSQFMKSKVATGVIGDRIDNHELKQWMVEWYEQGQPEILNFLLSKEVTI